MSISFPILSTILLLVGLFSVFPFFNTDQDKEKLEKKCRLLSLVFSSILLTLISCLFFFSYNTSQSGLQHVEAHNWFGNLITFKLGVDGLSVTMSLLAVIVIFLTILFSSKRELKTSPKVYYSSIFLFALSALGLLFSQDLILFFIFLELEILPVYLLILLTSEGNNRLNANRFLIYSLAAGALVLMGFLFIFWLSGAQTFSMIEMSNILLSLQQDKFASARASLLLIPASLLFVGFLIKTPSLPFHSWFTEMLPDLPLPLTLLMMFKVGGYALIRFGTLFFSELINDLNGFIALYAALNIILAAAFAFLQKDIVKLMAFSVVSHMGFVILGLAAGSQASINGSIFQLFSHGIVSLAIFIIVAFMKEQSGTTNIDKISGLANSAPWLFAFALCFSMANIGLPSLSGFVGESVILYSTLLQSQGLNLLSISALLSVVGIILTAVYSLNLIKKSFFGESNSISTSDLVFKQKFVLSGLFAISLLLGLLPALMLNKINFITKVETSK
jgi:proton-translocating NADH-quinone oxidoreductase chain M